MAAGARATRAAARRNPGGLAASRPGGGWSGLLARRRPPKSQDVTHGERRLLVCPADGRPRHADADADAGMVAMIAATGAAGFPGCRHGRWRPSGMPRAISAVRRDIRRVAESVAMSAEPDVLTISNP